MIHGIFHVGNAIVQTYTGGQVLAIAGGAAVGATGLTGSLMYWHQEITHFVMRFFERQERPEQLPNDAAAVRQVGPAVVAAARAARQNVNVRAAALRQQRVQVAAATQAAQTAAVASTELLSVTEIISRLEQDITIPAQALVNSLQHSLSQQSQTLAELEAEKVKFEQAQVAFQEETAKLAALEMTMAACLQGVGVAEIEGLKQEKVLLQEKLASAQEDISTLHMHIMTLSQQHSTLLSTFNTLLNFQNNGHEANIAKFSEAPQRSVPTFFAAR